MTYTRPGIYVSEGPFTTHVVSSPSTSAAAFIGTAERGPSSPALIQSWNSYKTQFGDLDVNYEMGYALYHFFANGGRTAYVNRVTSGASTSVAAFANFAGTVATVATATLFRLSAPSIGTWGNSISAVVSAGAVLFTMIVFTLLYGVLAIIEVGLTLRVIKMGPAEELDYADPQLGGSEDKQLVMAY
jgi:hypothetical protein